MRKVIFALLTVSAICAVAEEMPLSVWRMPQLWSRHVQLRQQLIVTIRQGDVPGMEAVCREALRVFPGDATWHYNLACALAKGASSETALDELDKSVDFGFRNADMIAQDADFARIRENPRFAQLVDKARALKGKPGRGHPESKPLAALPGSSVTVGEANVDWNFDLGVFEARLNVVEPATPIAAQAFSFEKSKPDSPERPYVAAWLSEGSAAGNVGDIYFNRDERHSMLSLGDFPGILNVQLGTAAKNEQLHVNQPNMLFPECAVFGNVSRARTKGAYWRSLARASLTDPGLPARMNLHYRNNQFWVLVAHLDYGKKDIGDVFPGSAPFQFVSVGSSWSDQPFLRAALAASAAMPRPTKQAILCRHLMGPTLQWLLRRTCRGIETEDDYLSPQAHPTAFEAARLDTLRLVEKSHALKPEDVPPVVSLDIINSRDAPVPFPVAGRDYPDAISEILYATSSAIALVMRAPAGDRTYLFHARADGAPSSDGVSFAWRVVHGDSSAVTISPVDGGAEHVPERGFAKVAVNRRKITERIDVACFAKAAGTEWGAPSIISFYPIPQETRVYRPDGKIESIDYSNQRGVYSDPVVALPRHWKDTYSYDAAGRMLGWTRSYNGKDTAFFTAAGDRIVERRADGTPSKVVHVKYQPRSSNDKLEPLTLSYIDDGEPLDVK